MPENGQPGRYKESVFTTDATGQLLKDIKIDLTKKTVLKLE